MNHGEVVLLVEIPVNHRRQEHLGAVGRCRVLIHPADVAAHQFLGAHDFHARPGQGPQYRRMMPLTRSSSRLDERVSSICSEVLDSILKKAMPLSGFSCNSRIPCWYQVSNWLTVMRVSTLSRLRRKGERPPGPRPPAGRKGQGCSPGSLGHTAQRLGAVGQEAGSVAQADLGQPLTQLQEASRLRFVHVLGGLAAPVPDRS